MRPFYEWAYWAISNPGGNWPLGFRGSTVEAAIQAGKGVILPRAPRGSIRSIEYNATVKAVDEFLKGRDRKVVLVFLGYDGSQDEKAAMLGVSRRQMVRQVHTIYEHFLETHLQPARDVLSSR